MANGQPGWYPDPGGTVMMFRYWDGRSWSDALSPTPYAQPPTSPGAPPGFDPRQPILTGASTSQAQPSFGSSPAGPSPAGAFPPDFGLTQPPPKKSPIGTIVLIVAGVVVLGLIGWFVVPRLFNGDDSDPDDPNVVPSATSSVCPPVSTVLPTPADHPDDGWVHGGDLAYPMLPAPWSTPDPDYRVPFGRDVLSQNYTIHRNYSNSGTSWVASVLVAELYAGDGFYNPQEGAEIVTECVLGQFYSDAVVTRADQRNEAYTLDGDNGWIIESTLSFNIPDLPTTSEDITIIVVATGEMTSSLFYSSVPNDSSPAIVAAVDNVISNLRVSQ
ncbi:MAG: DUF2510 domain-containing protein [Propionibacteriaceae bacterium]|jgi:hypothetical protein|nr:DUF2510 domain-containing protein [Propionibacteriaceae bacterium]